MVNRTRTRNLWAQYPTDHVLWSASEIWSDCDRVQSGRDDRKRSVGQIPARRCKAYSDDLSAHQVKIIKWLSLWTPSTITTEEWISFCKSPIQLIIQLWRYLSPVLSMVIEQSIGCETLFNLYFFFVASIVCDLSIFESFEAPTRSSWAVLSAEWA